jgi:hypothetical protein
MEEDEVGFNPFVIGVLVGYCIMLVLFLLMR